jgi:hypothetical protein
MTKGIRNQIIVYKSRSINFDSSIRYETRKSKQGTIHWSVAGGPCHTVRNANPEVKMLGNYIFHRFWYQCVCIISINIFF